MLTHGTWASEQKWYQPRGDFYVALDTKKPALGVHDKSYKWTGSYTGRRAAALALKQWIGDQGLVKPDFFAHSHGGTVANLATKQGVEFKISSCWPGLSTPSGCPISPR